jgi:hypothetical protein
MFDVHVPHLYQDACLRRFRMFGNGHHSIVQRWKAGDLLLHQSRAANKRARVGSDPDWFHFGRPLSTRSWPLANVSAPQKSGLSLALTVISIALTKR